MLLGLGVASFGDVFTWMVNPLSARWVYVGLLSLPLVGLSVCTRERVLAAYC